MTAPASPYKGLAPFGDTDLDALLFFGRERDGEIVVANLLASRLTVLYGASGVGKSSLLRAAVARRLRRESDAEVIVFSSWAGDTAAPLRAAQAAADAGREAYLILDQFEEYFLYDGASDGEDTLAEELPELLRRTERRVNVLISVREDALASLDAFKAPIPNVLANYLRLPHLDRDAGRAAITGPLERWSELAGEHEAVTIEPELVEAVLDETAAGRVELGGVGVGIDRAAANGGGPAQIEAPILQLVMERLWQAERQAGSRVLRLETFHALGGAGQIVRDHLERALGSLSPAQQDVAAASFDHLVTPSGSKIALRAGDLAEYAGVGTDELGPVVTTLARERILRSVEGGTGGQRYEIFHDVLADAVLAWRAERRVERERQTARRRHRRLLGVAAASIVALAIVSAIAVVALVERDRAREHERQATARELQSSALLGLPEGAADSLARALRAARLEPDEQAEIVLRRVLVESRLRAALDAPKPVSALDEPEPVSALQFSADGRRLLAARGPRVVLYDPDTGRAVRTFGEPAPVTAAILGPRGLLLTGGEDGRARLRDTRTGSVIGEVNGRGAVTSLAFDPSGKLLLVTTDGGTAFVGRTGGGRVAVLPHPGKVVRGVFNPTGSLVATVGVQPNGNARARVYDVASGRLLHVLPQLGINDVEFSPDGSLLATGSHVGTIGLWDPRTGRRVRLLSERAQNVKDLAFSPDGTLLAGAYGDGVSRVWTVADGELLYLLPGHTGAVDAVAWSPDGRVLADASVDETARLYAITGLPGSGGPITALPGIAGGASALAFDPSGARVATGSVGGGVRLWDATPIENLVPLGFHRGEVSSAVYSPDGRLAVSAGADRTARIWDVRSRRALQVLRMPGAVKDASFSPDGALVATASLDGAARLWRVRDGAVVRTLGKAPPLRLARFSPDGTLLAAASDDGTVVLWRVADGTKLYTLRSPPGMVTDVEFSPDGTTLATSSERRAALWSVGDGRLLHHLATETQVLAVDFSPDGRLLATGEMRGTARLWDAGTGGQLHLLQEHRPRARVNDAVFSNDGTRLLTTGSDNDGRTWTVPDGEPDLLLRGQFGALATGAFSPDDRWIVTAGPFTAVLWPAATGTLLYYLRGPTDRLTAVSFSPDGRQILAASMDGSVRTYDCVVCGELAELEALAEERLRMPGLEGSG
jgi:WD40 repeat protein